MDKKATKVYIQRRTRITFRKEMKWDSGTHIIDIHSSTTHRKSG